MLLAACDTLPTPPATGSTTLDAVPEATTASDILARTGRTSTDAGSFRFAFTVTRPTQPEVLGTGAWVAPDRYRVTARVRMCPPSLPGMPAPTKCFALPVYEAIGIGDDIYSHPGDGRWELDAEDDQFGLDLLKDDASPADMIVTMLWRGITTPGWMVDPYEWVVNGVSTLRLTSPTSDDDSEPHYEVFVEPRTYRLVKATITTVGNEAAVWTWTFSGYGAGIAIDPPVVRP
jgi:hypothetical protein